MTLVLYPLCAAVVTVAFGVLFNVRGFNLLLAGLVGGAGYFVFLALQPASSALAMFAASAAMAALAELAARRRRAPAPLFLVAGLIPIVPGGGMFNSLLRLIEGESAQALHIMMQALVEAGAIAAGIIVASSLIRLIPGRVLSNAAEDGPEENRQ